MEKLVKRKKGDEKLLSSFFQQISGNNQSHSFYRNKKL